MLFSALLLIEWVTLTIGGTSPLFPRKEIHLKIPIESHFTREFSGISPLIFRDSKEATAVGFRHPVKIPLVRKDLKDTRSSLKPLAGNVEPKARSGRQAMNSSVFQPFHSGRHIPFPSNMNRSSPDNVKDASKMTRLSHPASLRDSYTGRGEENNTLLEDFHDHHYIESFSDKVDPVINDTVSNSFILSYESSVNHEKGKFGQKEAASENEEGALLDKISTQSTQDNDSKAAELPHHKEHKNITSNFSNADRTSFHKNISSLNLSQKKKSEIGSKDIVELESNRTQKEIFFTNSETESKLTHVLQEHANQKNITPIIKVTRKPKSRMRNNRKQEFLSSPTSEISFYNKTFTKTPNANNQTQMLQDGAFQVVTASTALYSEKSWFRNDIDKLRSDGNFNQKSDISIKSSTISVILSSSLTTPDPHMNDPPFRGPNIPPEIDHFYKEKERTKMDYQNPTVVETPTFIIKNIGEDWKPEKQVWGIAWDCHYFVIGSFFAIIALYSLISLLRVNTFITLLNTGYYIAINSIILLLCLLRSLYLFYDPYNLSGKYPVVLASILPKITLPCLTSSFLFLMLSFLNSTKTQFLSPKFQRPSSLAFVIIFLFSLYLCLEISVCIFHASSIFIIAGHVLLIVWAKLSSISYFCVFRRLHHRALRKQGEMIRLTFTKMHIDGAQLPKKLPKPTLGLAVKLLLVSAILQTFICILTPFGMVIFQVIIPSVLLNDPWVWWGYQLTCRILELLLTATISFIATQPQKHFEIGDNRFCSILMWFPCSSFAECCKKEEVVDFEAHSDNYANPQGLRNTGFNLTANSRRLQTNSLPTFRTPLTELDKNLPMRTLPCSGRHTNHASAISLLSYYR